MSSAVKYLLSMAAIMMATLTQANAKSNLAQDETLYPNTALTSPSGAYSLWMQADGNLVMYNNTNGQATWASNTNGYWGLHATMQSDGNLVLYDDYGNAYWETGTDPTVGPELKVQDDGNLVVYGLAPIWETHTVWGACGLQANRDPSLAVLASNPVFFPSALSTLVSSPTYINGLFFYETTRISQNGCYKLVMQGDGNLVIYRTTDYAFVWASMKYGFSNAKAVLQADGNFVVYDGANRAKWATNTNGYRARTLVMQNDGNLVLYSDRVPVWEKTGYGYGRLISYAPRADKSLWARIFGDQCVGVKYTTEDGWKPWCAK